MMLGWKDRPLSYPNPISLNHALSPHLMKVFGTSSQEKPFREANPDICCRRRLNIPYDTVRDFLRNTCPSAAGKGVDSVDLGFVLIEPMNISVLSKSKEILSNVRSLGIPCSVEVRHSHISFPVHYLRTWKGFSPSLFLPQKPPEVGLSVSLLNTVRGGWANTEVASAKHRGRCMRKHRGNESQHRARCMPKHRNRDGCGRRQTTAFIHHTVPMEPYK